jgi:hypothetical protein
MEEFEQHRGLGLVFDHKLAAGRGFAFSAGAIEVRRCRMSLLVLLLRVAERGERRRDPLVASCDLRCLRTLHTPPTPTGGRR